MAITNNRMYNKFNRSNFIPKFENTIYGTLEFDLNNETWERYFNQKYSPIKHIVKKHEIHRPDLISLNRYGVEDYWWVVLKYNNIEDIYTDLNVAGALIYIPNINDINNYISNLKNNNKIDKGEYIE